MRWLLATPSPGLANGASVAGLVSPQTPGPCYDLGSSIEGFCKPFAMLETLSELWDFLKERKKFWLLPILLVLGSLGGLIVLTQGSAIAPFIYTLF